MEYFISFSVISQVIIEKVENTVFRQIIAAFF